MKTRICIFLLVASLAAYAQGRSGGASGGHAGGPPSGSMGSRGSMHSADAGSNANPRAGEMGKQSPDAVLTNNTQLNTRLQKLLPAGTNLKDACGGFKNVGQCIAAIHVANNLGISFSDLKTKMTGGDSLGKAIHEIKPDVDAKAEAKKGQKQANEDLSSS